MADDTLYDIVEPVAPAPLPPAAPVAWLPGALALAAVLLAAWWLHRRRWHRRLRRIAARPMPEAAYAVAALLQARWGLRRLDPAQPPRAGDPAAWDQLVQALERARYQPDGAQVPLPLAQVRPWL